MHTEKTVTFNFNNTVIQQITLNFHGWDQQNSSYLMLKGTDLNHYNECEKYLKYKHLTHLRSINSGSFSPNF